MKKEGVLKDSESVAIDFEGESVPQKVFLGYELPSESVCTKTNEVL